jgi:hypothetical protein
MAMGDRIMQAAAFLVVAGFLGIVLWHVPRLDLAGAIGLTLIAIVYDFFGARGSRGPRK